MQSCRLCLFESTDNISLISVFNCEHENLATKIWDCVEVMMKEDDVLPVTICITCLQYIVHWCFFKETCTKSQYILEKTYLKSLNLEKNISTTIEEPFQTESYSTVLTNITTKQEFCSIKNGLECLEKTNTDSEADEKSELELEDLELDDDEELVCLSNRASFEIAENTYHCTICYEEFSVLFEYLDHQETHNDQMVFKCDRCDKIFDKRRDLVEHDHRHFVPCPQCHKMILPRSMRLHLVLHTDKYKCSKCSSRFNSRATLAQHYTTMHTDIKDHVCETCGKCFSTLTSMRVHLKSHSDDRPYTCKLCNYAGRTSSAIYVHMSTHENGLRVCEVCSKTFKSNRNLHDHLRRVHSKEKKHACGFCDKKFVDKYMLRVHVRCHTGVRPYQCPVCHKAFIRSDGLKEHMVTHGQRIMYDCKDCGKKFTSRRGIGRHTCTTVT